MPMSEKKLLARDAERDVWQETLDAIQDIKNGKTGAVYQVTASPMAETHRKTGLSYSNRLHG